jgi:hypothetical protein
MDMPSIHKESTDNLTVLAFGNTTQAFQLRDARNQDTQTAGKPLKP